MADPSAYVYFVAWPGHDVAKVGYAGSLQSRISRYTSKRGGRLLWHRRFDHFADAFAAEELISRALGDLWLNAFTSRTAAEPLLGLRGSGWSECLRIPDAEWSDALHVIEDVMA